MDKFVLLNEHNQLKWINLPMNLDFNWIDILFYPSIEIVSPSIEKLKTLKSIEIEFIFMELRNYFWDLWTI